MPRAVVFERPVRLRRLAGMIDAQAEHASDPAAARELAREMRLRAAELECGSDEDRTDEDVAGEASEVAQGRRARALERYGAA
jgi:hypothetical protein